MAVTQVASVLAKTWVWRPDQAPSRWDDPRAPRGPTTTPRGTRKSAFSSRVLPLCRTRRGVKIIYQFGQAELSGRIDVTVTRSSVPDFERKPLVATFWPVQPAGAP